MHDGERVRDPAGGLPMASARRRALVGAAGALPGVLAWRPARAQSGGGTMVWGVSGIFPRHFNPALQTGPAQMLIGAQLFGTPLGIDRRWRRLARHVGATGGQNRQQQRNPPAHGQSMPPGRQRCQSVATW